MISASVRTDVVKLVKEANEAGARLHMACREIGISVRTYERWTSGKALKVDGRPGAVRPEPKNKLSEAERAAVISVMNRPEYASLPPSQVVPMLADDGVYIASESTIYRILRENNQQHHRGRSKAPIPREPVTHVASGSNQVWSWDITWLPGPVRGMYYRLYMIVDIYSRKIVGWEVWETESATCAETLIRRAVIREGIKSNPLVIHSDNGSPMKAATYQALLEALGITKSYSRPRVSNDNPYSESLFKTCKYRPGYPAHGMRSLEQARRWVRSFVEWYNTKHHHSGIGFVTPEERHRGEADRILDNRRRVYQMARERHPERWARSPRAWSAPDWVALGPLTEMADRADAAS